MESQLVWKIIDSYFRDNPQCLVTHHIESYNDFFKKGIFQIFKEKNPIRIQTRFDKDINDFRSQCIMYFGGKDGNKIYFGKPVIYDDNNSHYMQPNEARLRNMTYGMTIHYDIDIEFIDILEPGQSPTVVGYDKLQKCVDDMDDAVDEFTGGANLDHTNFKKNAAPVVDDGESKHGGAPKSAKSTTSKRKTKQANIPLTTAEQTYLREETEKSMISVNKQCRMLTLEKVLLGKFPIMLQSDFCILKGTTKEIRHSMGECLNDLGGYFIIDGKEKVVISQEKFADNMLYIRDVNDDKHLYSAEIRSVSENVSKPIRTLSVKLVAPSPSYTNKNIVVHIPNVRKPVPLFILFRALGIVSDKQIITMCLLDIEKYADLVDLFAPSVHDAGGIMTQRNALQYIALLTKGKTIAYALEILSDYFLPHIGEVNFMQKAYFLGYITFRLLSVHIGIEPPTDRDNFKYKRIELIGSLMRDLFREYYTMQQRHIMLEFDKRINLNQSLYQDNLYGLVNQFHKEILGKCIVESGFKKAFKGNWGAKENTKRIGVVQDLNRLSFNSALNHMRKTNLPLDASVKLIGPRILHSTHWGYFDPIDTPDGANIGIHKHLSISTYISQSISREPMLLWLREKVDMKLLEDCSAFLLSTMTKVILNGYWAGSLTDPLATVAKIRLFRRNGLIPIYTSVSFDNKQNTIFIYTDGGRPCRPVFHRNMESGKFPFQHKAIAEKLEKGDFTWENLVTGFHKKRIEEYKTNANQFYEVDELYEASLSTPDKLQNFIDYQAIIDFIDTNETESALISLNKEMLESEENSKKTHLEIHESFIFGMMSNMIIFPDNNPAVRNSFSCGQSKQAVSMYHTNHQVRMDKTAVVLNYGQTPLVKSRYLEYITDEGNPYGENAIVAIMCYTGYNVEDAVLINEGSLKRGLFRTTYYTTYEEHEEKSRTGDATVERIFTNIENMVDVIGTKPGFDYSKLDKFGLIRENTEVDDKTALIGITTTTSLAKDVHIDSSKTPKKGQLGIVDKTFITDNEEGQRIAKIRIREERIPNLGDKMASRSGQKGTVGLVIPEEDMPFTKDGLRPDIIINPHAIPTRMTIGQLVECITGKAMAYYGGFGDCTAFNDKGSKIKVFGELLPKIGYHSSGNELLYNGMTGEQISSEIFIGPNYYMRLKHMVKDKINFRALGPRTALTKQSVGGRANDGGLRIGEMERDSVISHGAVNFLTESMMERGDKYFVAVCNKTGLFAICNPAKNIFLSPMADGPIKYVGSLDGKDTHIENVSKFGRDFSVISIPYTFKLLVQELQTMNIQLRIITEDNIEQLENMGYSKNINRLLFEDNASPSDVTLQTKKALFSGREGKEDLVITTPIVPKEVSPQFPETSPAYMPEEGELSYKSPENIGERELMNRMRERSPNNTMIQEFINDYNDNNFGRVFSNNEYERLGATYNMNVDEVRRQHAAWFKQFAESNNMDNTNLRQSTTPEMPPPAPLQNSSDFTNGETVLYRGDSLPTRLWKIVKIGDKFITIQTENMEGLDTKSQVQVVYPSDIYRPSDDMFSMTGGGFNHNDFNAYNEFPQMSNSNDMNMSYGGMQGSQQAPPAINLAFKIMNGGNDFSSGEEPPNPQQKTVIGGETTIANKLDSHAISVEKNGGTKESSEQSTSNGGFDFSKMVFGTIKKLGFSE
jgi:DNA-directed RNA polymerase II subunit RPB2